MLWEVETVQAWWLFRVSVLLITLVLYSMWSHWNFSSIPVAHCVSWRGLRSASCSRTTTPLGAEGTPKAPGVKALPWAQGQPCSNAPVQHPTGFVSLCVVGASRSPPTAAPVCAQVMCLSPCELLRLSWIGSIPAPGLRKSGIFRREILY